MRKPRTKTWEEKVKLVKESYLRCLNEQFFIRYFYKNLFFLNPKISDYFKDVDMKHQEKALEDGLRFVIEFLDAHDDNVKRQILRISQTHSHHYMNVHPHLYYYWVEALVMTAKKCDYDWYDSLEHYWREVIYFPVTFIISRYYAHEADID